MVICLLLVRQTLPAAAQSVRRVDTYNRVPASASDFQVEMTSLTEGDSFAQYSELEYRITYGSSLNYANSLVLTAEWSEGTIDGESYPSLDILEYVLGSAGKAYHNTPAVIDTLNRRITWTIASFPAQTDGQSVSFKLRVKDTYSGSRSVAFTVSARLSDQDTVTPPETVTQSYVYDPSLAPTPTPIPTATPSPSPTPTGAASTPGPTATPTPEPMEFAFSRIYLRTVTESGVKILVTTNRNALFTLSYGTSHLSMDRAIKNSSLSSEHEFVLSGLTPQTTYFFRVAAADGIGESLISDIYTFRTAAVSKLPQIDTESLVFSSGGLVMPMPKEPATRPLLVIPNDTEYSFQFSFAKEAPDIERVQVVVRKKDVLGITNESRFEPGVETSYLFRDRFGNYHGRLKSPPAPGRYEVFVRFRDRGGNVAETKIAELRVTDFFKVIRTNGSPMEKVRIFLYYFEENLGKYLPLPSQIFTLPNPAYTDNLGRLPIVLTPGRYKANVAVPGFKPKTVTFTIGSYPGEEYPTVILSPESFSLISFGQYQYSVARDLAAETVSFLALLSHSTRAFHFVMFFTMTGLILVTFLSYASRTRLPLGSLVKNFLHHRQLAKAAMADKHTIKGYLFDEETRQPLAGADLYLIDNHDARVFYHAGTDGKGHFLLKSLPGRHFELEIMKKGYEKSVFMETRLFPAKEEMLSLGLRRHERPVNLSEELSSLGRGILAIGFESLLLGSLALELFFIIVMKWLTVIPFLALTLLNLVMWLNHLNELRRRYR